MGQSQFATGSRGDHRATVVNRENCPHRTLGIRVRSRDELLHSFIGTAKSTLLQPLTGRRRTVSLDRILHQRIRQIRHPLQIETDPLASFQKCPRPIGRRAHQQQYARR